MALVMDDGGADVGITYADDAVGAAGGCDAGCKSDICTFGANAFERSRLELECGGLERGGSVPTTLGVRTAEGVTTADVDVSDEVVGAVASKYWKVGGCTFDAGV